MPAVPDGWDMTVIDVETGTAKFDLCLVLDDRADGVLARFIYSSDLFERRTITRMMGHWQTLLEGVVANPDCRVSELPLLPGQERNQILVEWNRTEKEYPQEYAQQIFAKWAQATPNALAVECDGEGLSYAELDQRANQLAQYLISLGVQPGAPVAICIDRSLEMIVAILGVLKAGAAYVPVDPTYPRERIEFVLADCGAKVLLAQKNRRQHLSFAGTKIVNLDTDWNVIGRQPKAEPPVVEADETPAYIIYTSGSTGTPKGVVVSHRNLAQSTQARLSYYPEPARKFLLLSSVAFDSSIAGIFHALCSGGTLVVPPAGFRYTSSEVAAQIRRGRVTHTLCFPTLYRDLLEQAAAEDLATLRTVIVAGESCPKSLVDLHYSIAPQAALYNEYGPTEATVWCAVHPCEPGEQGNSVPIGEPIANARLYVLDRMMQPVPVNVPGELYIGGSGVALGYLNRPELTAEKFVADPFHPEGRLYKTGDLARHLADGTVEFLGRIDRQVKIHGLRIELEEVEAAIEGHPDVRECVVSMSADVNPQLHAHVVLRTQSFTTATELRAFLRGRMPASMVPAEFEFVASLPRTPNGKIDRPKLSTIERAGKLHEAIAPRDEIEKKLALIWQQVLDAKTNDVTEDFFVLGGHSLLAAQLLVRIEKEFSQELSLAFVFQAPTIEQMADLLRSPRQSLRARAIVPIQPKGARLPLFWVRGGPRFRKLAQTLGSDQPFLGLDLPFTDAHKLPVPYRIEDIAAFLIRAMKEVQPTGPYHLGGLCVNAVIAYEMACQLEAQGESVALLAMLDAHNQAFYKNPLSDGRYTGRIKYHLANLRQMEMRETPAYFFDRLDEARRKIERMSWQFSSSRKNGDESMRNTDSIVHPAFSRFEPRPYGGEIVLLQSSDWPQGPYFDFQLGWQELVGSIEFHQIPGDHALMFIEPNVDLLAARLKSHLTGCVAAATSDCKK